MRRVVWLRAAERTGRVAGLVKLVGGKAERNRADRCGVYRVAGADTVSRLSSCVLESADFR